MTRSFRRGCPGALAAAVLALCCSCEPPPTTLHPLSAGSAERRWEPRLLGTWTTEHHQEPSTASDAGQQDSSDVRLVFTRAGYYRYRVTGALGDLTAYVVPLGGVDFLDVTPDLDSRMFWQPVHVLVRLRLEGDRLRYEWVAQDRWEQLLRQHGVSAVHNPEHELLLVNETDSLRTLLQELLADSTVDWEVDSLTRARPAGLN